MDQILRIYVHEDKAEQQLDDILNYCAKTNCHEIMFLTTGYCTQPTFVALENIQSYTEKLIEWSEYLQKHKIEVSLNVTQTLGHIFFPEDSGAFPFQRQIVLDGSESVSSACPLCPNFRDYIIKVYKLYARVNPKLLFVDDDFRFISGGGMGCFCPLHIEEYNKRSGNEINFEDLTKAIFSPSSNNKIRKQFHDVLNDSMVELAELLGNSIREISSNTRVGFMSSIVPHSNWGCDLDQIAHAFAGEHKPLFRPQMPMYSELELKCLPRCFSQPAYARKMFSPEVEQYPEIENAYYTVFSKSAHITSLQMTSCLLNGMRKLTMLIFDWLGSPFSEGNEYISMISKKLKFFETLSDIIPEGSAPQGIGIPLHKHSTIVRRTLDSKRAVSSVIDPRHWDNYIPLLGLPVGFEWDITPHIFLTGDEVLAFSREKIESFLKTGVVMDVRTAECLCSLGFSERIGVRIEDILEVNKDLYLEEFHIGASGKIFIPISANKVTLIKKIQVLDKDKAQVLSSIINRKKEFVSPAVVAYENPQGERFGIIAYSPENDSRELFLNPKRKLQMRWLFEWVSKKPLPVSVCNAPYVQPVFHEIKNKKIVSFLNYSTDSYDSVLVSLPWYNIHDYTIYRLSNEGTLCKLENIIHSVNNLWKIKLNLLSANLEVIVFEKNNDF